MFTANNMSRPLHGLIIACVLCMSGCAHNATRSDAAANKCPPGAEEVSPYASMNPVPIEFGKLTVKLDDANKKILEQIRDRAMVAQKLTIIGYCDRNQIGNATAAATARAIAVRNELVRLGVPAKIITIKDVTDVADKHTVEIEF